VTDSHVQTSKFLSCILRHEPHAIGLCLDDQGWAPIDLLIEKARIAGHALDIAVIHEVVTGTGNEKKRFALSADGTHIRAVQGHSTTSVSIVREARQPPDTLYHGTARHFLAAILVEGLRPGQRHQVHLSANETTALEVGRRHGEPVLLRIDARKMHAEGLCFFQAENGVWLTEHVPAIFLAQ